MKIILISLAGALFLSSTLSAAVSPELASIRSEWAMIKYQLPKERRADEFKKLVERAHALSLSSSAEAEPKIWEAIILSSLAGEKGGLDALSKVKQAKALLEDAEKINPGSMDGSIYTTLGSLYYQVPGWPIGFGDDDKARQFLLKALDINPDGIDANYFYGDYLIDQGRFKDAVIRLEKALKVPGRPDRPVADAGRREEIKRALERAKKHL